MLRKDGTVWLNYGDAYAGGNGRTGRNDCGREMLRLETLRRILSKAAKRVPAPRQFLKPKDLMMMPARVALALQADGWWLRSEIIWAKPNPMPESCTDRPTSSHEKVFLFAKSAKYFYDAEAVRTKSNGWHGDFGSASPERRDNTGKGGKKRGHAREHEGFRDKWDAMPKEEQQSKGANLRNVWTIDEDEYQQFLRWKAERAPDKKDVWRLATYSFPGSHFATFPPALVEPCIKAGTSEKGCCVACGGPWVRVVSIEDKNGRLGAGYHKHDDDLGQGQRGVPNGDGAPMRTTTGWQPTCSCVEIYCTTCCTVIDSEHEAQKAGTDQRVSDLQKNIPAMAGESDQLQSGMLQQKQLEAGSSMRRMRKDIPTETTPTLQGYPLFQDMYGEIQRKDEIHNEGLVNNQHGLSADTQARPPKLNELRIHDGASPSDGRVHRSASDSGRSRTSHERRQVRQQNRESSIDEKERPRRVPEANLSRRVSSLSEDLPSPGQCPHCGCDAEYRRPEIKPCLILDIFAGSGTVGLVADRLGRDAILIEINPEYANMARERITGDAPLFAPVKKESWREYE